jgi:ACDE family multidrug resistance protein
MHQRRLPEWVRHAPTPGVRGFAVLAGIEAIARGILISVFPLIVYNALQDAKLVSEAYFLVGIVSLTSAMMVPWVVRYIPRRYVYSAGSVGFAIGSLLAIQGTPLFVLTALLLNTVSVVTIFVCFNAYVLDYISKVEMGNCETSRMFYSALGWTVGPVAGVALMKWWEPAPFLISSFAALIMLGVFLYLRLGNGRLITKAKKPPPNPMAFLGRFFEQPRLVAGWLFAVIRSCAWWVYVVYVPIFAIETGLGDQIGGVILSITNGTLFLTPLMLRWMQKRSIRQAIRLGFSISGLLFISASLFLGYPFAAIFSLMLGSFFLILLDVSAGLPFLLAVKPSERTEMSAIYSSYRDVSGIVTPGVAWLVLLFGPVSSVFAASGIGLLFAWGMARKLNPRLGKGRIAIEP